MAQEIWHCTCLGHCRGSAESEIANKSQTAPAQEFYYGDRAKAGETAKHPHKVTQQESGEFQEVVIQDPKASRSM